MLREAGGLVKVRAKRPELHIAKLEPYTHDHSLIRGLTAFAQRSRNLLHSLSHTSSVEFVFTSVVWPLSVFKDLRQATPEKTSRLCYRMKFHSTSCGNTTRRPGPIAFVIGQSAACNTSSLQNPQTSP